MENITNSKNKNLNIKKNIKPPVISILDRKPLATFVAATIFSFNCSPAISSADNLDGGDANYTHYLKIINNGDELYLGENETAKMTLIDDVKVISNGQLSQTTVSSGGTLAVNENSKSNNTKINSGGRIEINPGSQINNTVVDSGGFIVIDKDYGSNLSKAILNKTDISGILSLRNSVILEGVTEFQPGSVFEVIEPRDFSGKDDHEFFLINNGTLVFSNNKDMKIDGLGIQGSRGLIKGKFNEDDRQTTLALSGWGPSDPDDGDYSYTGETQLMDGILVISNANFFHSPIIGREKTALWIGDATSGKKTYLQTTVQDTNVWINDNSNWDMTGNSTINELNTSFKSSINLNHDGNPSNILLIKGNYSTNVHYTDKNRHRKLGLLIFNTQLGDDVSPTDLLIVQGNTSGRTNVKINNIGGKGDKKNSGILLIQVLGESNGVFEQVGRNKVGAFEYKLGRGDGALQKNWYLRSSLVDYNAGNKGLEIVDDYNTSSKEPENILNRDVPQPTGTQSDVEDSNLGVTELAILADHPIENADQTKLIKHEIKTNHPALNIAELTVGPHYPEGDMDVVKTTEVNNQNGTKSVSLVAPTAPVVPAASVAPRASVPTVAAVPAATVTPTSQPQVYAPENVSYIANIVMARNLFNTRLEDRTGSYQYKDAISGQWQTSSMWMRTQGGKNNFGQAVEQLDIHGKYYSVQLGMDVVQAGNGRIGMLAGLGRATNHSRSNITGYYANGTVSGYNLGVYATWLPEQKDNTGFYVDTLAQYSWFNNTVNGQEQAEDKYKSSGFTTSMESGYTFKMATYHQLNYFIQPNAQLTFQGIQTQTHKTAYGESISDSNKGHLVTRIGAKTYLQTIDSADSQFTPFFAINWRHQNQNTGTVISGQRVESKSKNSTEFQIGVESKIEQQLHVWATIDYQMGRYNDKNANAVAGIKYHF